MRTPVMLIAATFAMLAAGAATALAGVVVIESRLPNLKRGQELANDSVIDVPQGARILVAVPQGPELKTVEIRGPRQGTVLELLNPAPVPKRVLDMVRDFASSGGTNLGSTAAARGSRILLNQVPLSESTVVCVEQGSLPAIALGSGVSKASLRIVDTRNSQQARVIELNGEQQRVNWPAAMALRDAVTYQVLEDGQPRIDLTIKTIPTGTLGNPGWIRSLETLERAGCDQQLVTSLRSIMGSQ